MGIDPDKSVGAQHLETHADLDKTVAQQLENNANLDTRQTYVTPGMISRLIYTLPCLIVHKANEVSVTQVSEVSSNPDMSSFAPSSSASAASSSATTRASSPSSW